MDETTRKKRLSYALERRERRIGKELLIYAGLTTVGSGGSTIGLFTIENVFSENFPDIIKNIPQYEDYFFRSVFAAVMGGGLFGIYPCSLTLWVGRILVGASIILLDLAFFGFFKYDLLLFVPIIVVVFVIIGERLETLQFYRKKALLDVPLYVVMSLIFIIWTIYQVYSVGR